MMNLVLSVLLEYLAKNWRSVSLPMEVIECLVDANIFQAGALTTMFMKFASFHRNFKVNDC